MAREEPMTHVPVFEQLGESQVRMQFGGRSDEVGTQAREWLLLKEQERAELAAAKRDAREERTLAIAADASRWARWAAIIAIIAIAIATKDQIIALIL